MSLPFQIGLQSRVDGYSYQVYTDSDERFWFRLLREWDRDIITDYFLGSFPSECSGALLAECYKTLGFRPRTTIVFRDILSGTDPSDTTALKEARELYESAGESLLAQFGYRTTDSQTVETRGKINLLIFGSET
ncbi:MAG: hypothetical protein JOZ32_14035 [Bryobacterales bacterium]|nr:hypothetical protein [Bryobacterales bacterium]